MGGVGGGVSPSGPSLIGVTVSPAASVGPNGLPTALYPPDIVSRARLGFLEVLRYA